MKLEYGDAIERTEAEWVRNNLPEYEEIWSRYIGHDGFGHPLRVHGLREDESKNREKFFQAHYTLLICLVQIRDILASVDQMHAYVPDPRAYLAIQRDLTSFLAYVGQARDMFKKMDAALGLGNSVWPKFQDLYQNRCSFLHGPITAQRLDDGILEIPILAGNEKTSQSWHDESRWSDSANIRFDVAPEQLAAIYNELSCLSRSGLSDCLHRIKEILASRNAAIEPDPQQNFGTTGLALSGVNIHPYSAVDRER